MGDDHFARLPEGCISEILLFTSALDASRSSTLSKGFKFAAESNYVWKRFLPPDYQKIISTAVSPVIKYATNKELYFSLCQSHVLIDGGQMSFSLDKRNGKKIIMIRARELELSWKGCWDFSSHTNSRFCEAAILRSIGWIHIQGKIKLQLLSKNTTYAAYLVFWLERIDGLKSSTTVVKLCNDRVKDNNTRNDQVETRESGKIARKRSDGWMEIEMGKFYNSSGDGVVEAWLIEINNPHGKSGLVIEGIEFRPA